MRVRYDAAARDELVEAVEWYESERVGLGAAFHERVRAAERRIAEGPLTHAVVDDVRGVAIRRVLVDRFPYGLLFMSDDGAVWILAVMHLHRLPGYWRLRAARLTRG